MSQFTDAMERCFGIT